MSSRQDIILIGAGGFGREVAAWIDLLKLPFLVVGFLDDQKKGVDIIDSVAHHMPQPEAVYLNCMGNGAARQRIRILLESRGARFAQLVDPLTRSTSPLTHSANSIFLGMSSIANNTSLGSDLLIHGFSIVGHDVTIEDGVTVGAHSFVGGGAVLRICCTVHPHATVLPGVTIGEHAVVGAGSVVIRNVEAHTTVFGAPAKVISRGKAND